MKPIFQVHLRTLDVEAAKDFYRSVLGSEPTTVWPLHEQAIARGAKPHWLGYLDVGDDVEQAAASFRARGASSLGPKWTNAEGLEAGVMRDPGGAILALAKTPPGYVRATVPELAFFTLNTTDVTRAMATYGELFGWSFDAPLDLGNLGVFHSFHWEAGGPRVGVFADTHGRPGVHSHWLYHFKVPSLEAAIARVRAGGGVALEPLELRTGDRMVVCDDPQGATFALHEDSLNK